MLFGETIYLVDIKTGLSALWFPVYQPLIYKTQAVNGVCVQMIGEIGG